MQRLSSELVQAKQKGAEARRLGLYEDGLLTYEDGLKLWADKIKEPYCYGPGTDQMPYLLPGLAEKYHVVMIDSYNKNVETYNNLLQAIWKRADEQIASART